MDVLEAPLERPPIGKIKTFGPLGPKYQVIRQLDGSGEDAWFEVLVIETGERLRYPWAHLRQDPDAD